jgi:uncharacterized membrane-anchored protein
MSRNALIAALVAPLFVLVLGIVRAENHLADAKRWQFEITGYDPRDMLRGHYLQYRLALNEHAGNPTCSDDTEGNCCFCLTTRGDDIPPDVERTTCDSAQGRCQGILPTHYLTELQRYYIPEASADVLTTRLRDAAAAHRARLVVAIDANGKPQVDALLVSGKRIEDAK